MKRKLIRKGPLKGIQVIYADHKKKFKFDGVRYDLSKYNKLCSYHTLYFDGIKHSRFGKNYAHTVDVSELLFKKKLKCNKLILFDFNKKNELMSIEIIKSR